ncbi:4'-phosphopantetheinyl transferase superfamily protein [Lactococcus lactis subsp. lactis]|uniref:4'-phosphopantetheinyl transferase family protein n=1 Tax=Lactococcus lactis TaxID=1358 RepID=UPI002A81A470|nr:4'-phosphopantetheinyl transferase superfamily protein [Lactococcus lactis]MDY4362316.1 4'-phosphopantetheinyl transferase superfamily protein [Lactococcus lactis subsp. lactis]
MSTIKVYYIDLRHFTQQDDSYLEDKLSNEKWKKIQHYRRYADKKRSIYSEMLIKYVVYKIKGHDVEIEFEENSYGKPKVKGLNWDYNVSHSGNYVILAISNEKIGIDIQKKFEIDLGVLKFFHKSEQKMVQEDPSLFFTFWTLKESYLKYLGVGLSKELDSFSIIDPPNFKCSENPLIVFENLNVDNDYSSFVCYEKKEESKVELIEVQEDDLISTIDERYG